MPPTVIDLRKAEDTRDVVHRAVQCLVEGRLVVFPTETVYGVGASACSAGGVEKIFAAKGRSADSPLALAIKSAEEALDYSPNPGRMAERLARRCWPGPVTLVVDCQPNCGLVSQLPAEVRQAVVPNNTLGLRVPAHPLLLEILKMLAGPIALTSANRSGQPDAESAAQAVESLGQHVDLVLDDGPCHYGQPSTVVRTSADSCSCLREGVVGKSALDRLSSMIVLLVCTGNTCRSPMAEVMMRQLIAEKLGCTADELEQRGVIVASAGIAATSGYGPAPEAVEVLKSKGLDLSSHASQALTDKLMRHADVILTMTGSHRQAILRRWPEASSRTHTLCAAGSDVHDPIGGSLAVYQQCADQIATMLQARVEQLEFR